MGDSLAQREAPPAARGPQRRESYGGAPNPQKSEDEDVSFVRSYRGAQEKMSGESARIADRRLSSPPVVHQRHMPVGTQKFHIPRKTKEKLALFQPLSCESREYEDMLTILTSGYLDPASSGCFTYSNPRLVHSEAPEKEFVEKRKELKADGRTEKELEESYCFMSVDSYRLPFLCEKGLFIGQSRITVLGNPQKGVYLSRCSDLLQMNPLTPGAAGEILIFKVIKGKVKSIYENMKTLLDPTPRFDSHLSKNISKVTSVMSYRAFELTQHYFYEYSFDELQQRPRQVCPYAVVSFQFKGKDTPLASKPMAPLRSNSQMSEKSQEFTVWSGDMVINDRVLFQVSLRSSSPPFLPLKLPEKLDLKCVMSWSQATTRLPQSLFSYDLYNNSSKEVEKDGFHCSLLEVVDRSRSMLSVTKLLQELESKAVVMVAPLTERGFLFLLSSVQMASTHERGENWRRSLHALFVFPESRCSKSTPQSVCPEPSPDSVSADRVMPGLNHFVPALHFALGKARTNPPPDLSTGVEQHAREYINGIKEGVLRPYPMGMYEPELEQAGRQYPVPKLHRLGLDTCLRPYLCAPGLHLLQLSRVRALVHSLCVRLNQARPGQRQEPPRMHLQADQKMQQLIDLVLSCKRNAEQEVESEVRSGAKRKRLEQETAQRAIKHLKASQELQRLNEQQQDATEVASPSSLTSLIGSVGLKDTDLQEDGSELASKLFSLLNNLNQKATSQSTPEPGPKESSPFDRLAIKLGLPTNCDFDLRRQEDFEGGSVSSQEGGFSPSGDPRPPRDRDPRRRPKTTPAPEVCEEAPTQPDIPWVLIPITGLPMVRHARKDADVPQDPRLHHLVPTITTTPPPVTSSTTTAIPLPAETQGGGWPSGLMHLAPEETLPTPTATSLPVTTTTSIPAETLPRPTTSSLPMESVAAAAPSAPSSPTTTPDPSPPASPSQCPSPDPSSPPSHCPSPEPEPVPASSPERDKPFNDPHADRGEAFEVPPEDEDMLVSRDTAEASPEEPPDEPSPVACPSSPQPSPKSSSPQKLAADSVGEGPRDVLTLNPESPPLPSRDIDSIVNRHLDSFSSDIQSILQTQCVFHSVPQSPHSTSNPERRASTLSRAPMFSQYVSFYHPCPPVQRYVSSLQNQISCVLNDYANNWTPNRPDTTTTTTTTVDLASRVSEFVSSIRAANDDTLPEAGIWQTDTEGEVATSSTDYLDNTIQANVVSSDQEIEMDGFGEGISNNGRRQVQFSSNHIEICIRNEPEHSSGSSRDVEEGGDANAISPPLNSNQGTLNSLIHELQPEVYTNLVEIIKDLKRNAQHFYIHCAEEDDYTIQQIRAQLLKQSYIEKSPVLFLNQEENSNGKLLVVIKNQDIAAHIHQIPELLSLKRRPTVQFLGMDSAEDLRNQSCQELFVSGGQVLSDEMVLNPDCVSHDKLSALLSVLEKHSSAENLWRWKVHCKTHKKLKEQSRFRRDAASLLEVLLSFQRKQIVDFLPYHKCDMSQGCELLDCAVELQGRYSNYRHTVVLTENRLENSSDGGVIVCGIDEFLHDFRKLVAYNDDIPQPISEEPQSTEDPSQSNPVPSEDVVPAPIPLHSEQDFAVLHRAISQLRAERQQQLKVNLSDTNSDKQGAVSTTDVSTTSGFTAEQRPFTPPSDKVSAVETVQLTPGRQAVAVTLDLIHTSLQPTDEDRTPRNQARIQVQTQVQTVDDRRSPESQVPLASAGRRQNPDIPDQTHDLTTTQSRVQVVTQAPIDRRRSPENKVPGDSIGLRTSSNSQVQIIDPIPSDSGEQVQSQVPIDRRRSPETQVLNLNRASTQSRAPQQLPIDHKQSLEAQVQVPTGGGGSQWSSVPSAPQRGVAVPGKSEPASAPVRPPAPNTSLNQSRVNQGKNTTPSSAPESSRSAVPVPSALLLPVPGPAHLTHPHPLSFRYMGQFVRPPLRPMHWGLGFQEGRGRMSAPPRRGSRGGYNGM